ncbi:transposase [Nonomuraea sp. FMUSA5-5]|uniref:Transposase n=1 Tax=Nonomuraea composti TaxID=2720023 RepID=A0ABX1BL55_9ACTN|nr:transposase [Nonomuraea sp. FMUSA5-5]NJP98469.1 transposase [Nonomuraea sp. FMUSA5-5]
MIKPHLPLGERGLIPALRQQFDAVMWRFRTGSPWRDLPVEYGPWSTVYDRFRSWVLNGVLQRLIQAMIAEAAALQETVERERGSRCCLRPRP